MCLTKNGDCYTTPAFRKPVEFVTMPTTVTNAVDVGVITSTLKTSTETSSKSIGFNATTSTTTITTITTTTAAAAATTTTTTTTTAATTSVVTSDVIINAIIGQPSPLTTLTPNAASLATPRVAPASVLASASASTPTSLSVKRSQAETHGEDISPRRDDGSRLDPASTFYPVDNVAGSSSYTAGVRKRDCDVHTTSSSSSSSSSGGGGGGERTTYTGRGGVVKRFEGVSCCAGGMDFTLDEGGGDDDDDVDSDSIYIGGGDDGGGGGVGISNIDSDTIYTGGVSNNTTNSSVHRTSNAVDVSNSRDSIYMGSIINSSNSSSSSTTTTTAAAATATTTTTTDSDIYTNSVGSDCERDIYTARGISRHVQHSCVYEGCSPKHKTPRYQQHSNSTNNNTFVRNTDQSAIKQLQLQQQQQQLQQHYNKCRHSEVSEPYSHTTHTHHVRKKTLLKTTSPPPYSMNTLPALSIFCLLLFNLVGSTYADICPKVCYCLTAMKHIGCAKKNLTEIPDLIPNDAKQLSLNGNIFSNKVLVRKNFSRLSNLEDLFLNECGIEVITLDTFADLKHLCMLDLSNNKLRFIEDYTFRGLSLKHLFLNNNPGIQFAPKAFTGFRTIGLHLKKCGLHNLSLEEIRPLNGTVHIIWLNNNNFKYLPQEWYYLLKNFEHVRLENNPMHCNCELTWLYRMFINNSSLFPKDEFMSCESPKHLKSKTFDMLTEEDFQCQLPIFEEVDVLVGPHVGKLSCRAKADPPPTLYWHKPGGLTETFRPSKDRTIKTNKAVLYIHNHHSSASSRYRCVANNPAGNVTFNLQVTWPQSESDNKNYITTLPTESSLPKTRSRSSNQTSMNMGELARDVVFTLMELIGAVIGTFLLTFLLCLLIFHFFGRQPRPMGPQEKEHSEKRRTPENHYVMADIDESSIKMMEHKDLVS